MDYICSGIVISPRFRDIYIYDIIIADVGILSPGISPTTQYLLMFRDEKPGQIIATSHDRFPPNGGEK